MLRDCCNLKGSGIQCLGCQECCASCAETCDCCGTASVESCLDACCPKRSVCSLKIDNRTMKISFSRFSQWNSPMLLHAKRVVVVNVVQ